MQCMAIFILLLAACQPLLVKANKIIFMIPRHVRRIHGPPPRYNRQHVSPYPKKTSLENNRFRNHEYNDNNNMHENADSGFYFNEKTHFNEQPYLHNSDDDFDQSSEQVNHVVIPHGKGITHGISFGKGYVPYEDIKEYFSSETNEYNNDESNDHFELDHDGSNYSPTATDYQQYPTEGTELYFPDATNDDSKFHIQKRSKDDSMQKSRHVPKSPQESTSMASHEDTMILSKTLPKDNVFDGSEIELSAILQDGTKGTIVAQDTVSLTDYNQKVKEFTRSWPGPVSSFVGRSGSSLGGNLVGAGTNPFSGSGLSTLSFPTGTSWLKFPGMQGYAVREDTMEEPYDFRTMPIGTTNFQPVPIPMTTFALPTFPRVLRG